MRKPLFVKIQDNLSGICITRWMNTRTGLLKFVPNENSVRFIHFHSESVLLLFIHQRNRNWKGKNSWNDFVVSGLEVIALDDGMLPRSTVKKLAFIYVILLKVTAVGYLRCCIITCLIILYYLYCLRPELIKINAIYIFTKVMHGKLWCHRARTVLHEGVR